ncbi:MAG: hypothetical protein C4532_06175 [Candidatus Abyssobacteria bacterium SURF_17]|jgi:hypothetical protein|uniref:Peptidase M14 domain-containing protein n=1 Tax=Candidatus Abyssobacteria bacterium SURF_17 TaxID=2093361 RepID=A0A419F1Z8_9BACT|nr:MAG: hypothetical protein C4532_06175 [Candidatus Abyssubacteria bacterium SURF_17]
MDITGAFQGGNPQDLQSIVPLGNGSFAIYPFSEDEDACYKFRLDVKVIANGTEASRRVKLQIHWGDVRYIAYRTRIFAGRNGDDWTCHDGTADGDVAHFELDVPPGETYLTLNPKYDYDDYLRLIRRGGDSRSVATEMVTQTLEGREIWLLATRNQERVPKIMVTARAHPYETGGSYCIEGILDDILDGRAEYLQSAHVFVLPMLSPDGVSNGLCKLSRTGGEDIARSENRNDPLVASLFSLVERIQPHFILDLHNWMIPSRNGLYYEKPRWMRQFVENMGRRGHNDREWTYGTRKKFFAESPTGLKAFAKRQFGTRCMTVEYPWFGRSVVQMKRLGSDSLRTVVEMLVK